MSVIKAFRVVALVLVSTFVPATALAGTTDARPARVKIETGRVAKAKSLKVTKVKAAKGTKAKAGKISRIKPRTAR